MESLLEFGEIRWSSGNENLPIGIVSEFISCVEFANELEGRRHYPH